MRVVTYHAVQDNVLALEQLLVLLVVPDKAAFSVDSLGLAAQVALTTLLRIAIHVHAHAMGIAGMQAAGAMAPFALNARLGPGPHDARQVVLVRTRWPDRIAGGVAGATVVRNVLLTGAVGHPPGIRADSLVGKVILGSGVCITSDDVAVLVDEASFPVVATNDVANVVPGVPLRRLGDFGEWIVRRLAIHHRIQLPGVARFDEHLKDLCVTCSTGFRSYIFGTGR
jgi:hypothetical protein